MLNPASPVSPTSLGRKRPHPSVDIEPSPPPPPPPPPQQQLAPPRRDGLAALPSPSVSASSNSSSFRNVSACNRCRLRKNRCDQRLPRCQSCEKAGVRCVGYDPITKREIPRSYVYFLEARVAYLESLLMENHVTFKEAAPFDEEGAVKAETGYNPVQQTDGSVVIDSPAPDGTEGKVPRIKRETDDQVAAKPESGVEGVEVSESSRNNPDKDDSWRINNLVSNIGTVSVQGTSDPRYLGSTSGISFARVVFAAVKSTVSGNPAERGPARPSERLPHSATGTGGSTTRDSFFGLQTRPMMKCAGFPDRELADKLSGLYFEHANPQMPILHRNEFVEMMDRTYAADEKSRSPRSLYILNIVFAIGAGIIFDDKPAGDEKTADRDQSPSASTAKKPRFSNHQYQPEEYHASAVIHLESFLGATSPGGDGFGALEELQAVLLLANFALLRPVAPGLWYIVGVATRLAVDLGLHYEDGAGIDSLGDDGFGRGPGKPEDEAKARIGERERGRREWVRDLRRRLWWCVYSFDRLVSCCVGRPFGISDQAISTEFPSLVEDTYITKNGITEPPEGTPSYKYASYHYFKLRVLQSEIHDVLQHQQARFARQRVPYAARRVMRSDLTSPFLHGFESFRSWRKDVHRRLAEWKQSAPTRRDTGVQFSVEFLELNYWQAVIMLYQQSLTAPAELADEVTPAEDVSSPSFSNVDEADDEDEIYYKVAEAGQKVIRIYRQMHRVRLVNYTYLATHHIFMAGISFLYALWHSPLVRSRLTLDEVDFTVLAATSVLGDLMHKCPPAEACRDAFERMSKATVQMCLSTTGFGTQVDLSQFQAAATAPQNPAPLYAGRPRQYRQRPWPGQNRRHTQMRQARPMPRFDMNLGDLFGDNNGAVPDQSDRRKSVQVQPYPESSPPFSSDQQVQSHPPSTSPVEFYGSYENPASPQTMQQQQQQQQQRPPQQQQQQYYYGGSPQSVSPNSINTTTPHTAPFPPSTDQGNLSGIGLDFLDFDPTAAEGQVPFGSDEHGEGNMQGIIPSLGHGAGHSVGIDLGFGMAVDFQHDWSENANYDIFDGYFFGGSGPGPSGEE